MLGNWKEQNELTFINLVLRVDEDETPRFDVEEDFKPTGRSVKNVTGTLVKIEKSFTKAKNAKSGDVYWAKIMIKDEEAGEIYVISTTVTNAAKWLLNWLLSEKAGTKVEVFCYKNKKNYATTGVKSVSTDTFTEGVIEFMELATLENKGDRFHAEIDKWVASNPSAPKAVKAEGWAESEITPEDIPF